MYSSIDKRSGHCAFLIAAACLLAWTFCINAADAKRPNLLLITADDLGTQLSCYGDAIARTPQIDQLAAQSVQFTTAWVTQASCSPSRSSMFTGLYPHGNGQYGLANNKTEFRVHESLIDQLLPNILKRAGYRTGIIGKLHVAPEGRFAFDERVKDGFGTRQVRKQSEHARDFISADSDKPWFLMFNVFDPHAARRSGADAKKPGSHFFPDQVDKLPAKPLIADEVPAWPWQGIDTPEQRTKIAGYYNCVQRVDAAVGLLMDVLQESGQSDNTLIIFLGDHGPPFTRGKTTCYEAGLRVPFLVRWPGVSSAHVSDRLVSSVDIYPTFLDAAGIEAPENLHGQSLRPVLTEENDANWRETLVAEYHYHGTAPFFPRRAITDGRYKLIHNLRAGEATASPNVDGDRAWYFSLELAESNPARKAMDRLPDPPAWELYDLKDDLVEFHNRAGEAELNEVENRLKKSLSDWQKQTDDRFADPDFLREVQTRFGAKKP